MTYLKKLICLIFLIVFYKGYSQEGLPVYFDYLSDNYYLIHPAMAGVGQGGKVRLTARKQWFDVEKAPSMQTLNAHMRVGDRSGIGAILFNDENGYHSQKGMKLTYAHHLVFSRNMVDLNQLSFGMSVGFVQSSLDQSDFLNIPDPAISLARPNTNYFNVDIGASYNFLEFYTHFTVKNVLGSGRDLFSAEEFDNTRRYLFSVGYLFFANRSWQLEPSLMLQATEYTKESSLDVNAKIYKKVGFGKVWGGLSYRRSFDGAQYDIGNGVQTQKLQLFTPIMGVNYGNFMFAYNYTYQNGDVRFDNGGFHQITIGYDFLKGKEPYNCNCPAVNY